VSESFCSTCTRGRISADGKFFTCLFATEGFDLKGLVRSDATDEDIISAFSPTWEKRGDKYSDERTAETAKKKQKIEMSYIGG
jgi:GTP 3',8-cyclase